MARIATMVLLAFLVGACTGGGGNASTGPGQPSPGGAGPGASTATGGGAGGAGAAAALAAAAKDACSIMPVDAVKAVVPKAGQPVKAPEPSKCSMGDGVSVVEITVDANALTTLVKLDPCTPVSGVGVSACLQEQLADDAYVQVQVTKDPVTILYVEVAGNDGKSHKDDAVNVAKAILAKVG